MHRIVQYLIRTPKRGAVLKPTTLWNGDIDFKFEIVGIADADMAKDPDTRKSVSGWHVLLNGAVLIVKSKTQPTVSLSVTESEIQAGASCAQDMVFVKKVLESLGL